ncbi:hypothetical protein A3C23_01625 [Candidatus Roizmanbacteria bacterium RIFCSPHIGHO2_02_FULL_37_13b]|uniref:R3H domain-containing protein n=1 Tax=Candidatus Roizmanbacteria bacterium RIFCSPLOWO2_02_FULL_36_11 TaxID=1802071 RepID=A0A1F7JCB9_9BACT|nr:MAG: hypothetical protein A3C23_01625 [Candidatus Roizmanbacteria bacterium RIFCSPHIGHO2_02_FULL_37_13b]OGK53215.1 MAG: hypothetical protein A3H78_02670 [Candidatus Roizmanbacteria bacterium RIFCSPLOWO2_02_FULL_36_11]
MDKKKIIKEKVTDILNCLSFNPDISVEEVDNVYQVTLKTESEASLLIGRYGETLSSLQRVMEAILYKSFGELVPILVNVNDYREKQKERIENIAKNIADRTIAQKKISSLSSFSSFERKLIHEYVSKNFPELESFSEGVGRDRKIFIKLKGEEEIHE